jgi:hypothetical protein
MKHWEYHPEYVDGCFGCKGMSVQMNAGELDAYKEARAQGIQPAGTTMSKIQEAVQASETLGRAYDSSKMPAAKTINNKSAAIMKELGV